jgi:hypothetical protein
MIRRTQCGLQNRLQLIGIGPGVSQARVGVAMKQGIERRHVSTS